MLRALKVGTDFVSRGHRKSEIYVESRDKIRNPGA